MKRFVLLVFSLIFASKALAIEFDRQLQIINKNNRKITIDVAVADTPDLQSKGLMGIKNLENYQGMYFKFEKQHFPLFWMKDTPLPLDIIFIDASGQVISIAKDMQPFSEDTVTPELPAIAALEIKAGVSKKLGIEKSSKILLQERK